MPGSQQTGRGRLWRQEVADGLHALEGYLLWQAEAVRARDRARAFTEGLPWLTTAQREEVERVYAADHLHRAEDALRAVAERCDRLRAEYGGAYARLRRRLTAYWLLAAAALAVPAAWWTTVR